MLRNPGPTRIICEMARVYPVSPTPIDGVDLVVINFVILVFSYLVKDLYLHRWLGTE